MPQHDQKKRPASRSTNKVIAYSYTDIALWLLVLAIVGAGVFVGVTTGLLPLIAAMDWVLSLVAVYMPALLGMFIYDVLSNRLENEKWNQENRRAVAVMKATRLGGMLMPLLAFVLLASLPWSWPAIVAVSFAAPLVMMCFGLIRASLMTPGQASDRQDTPIHQDLELDPIVHDDPAVQQKQLYAAARHGHLAAVEALVALGVNVCQADSFGRTALGEAASAGRLRVVEYLYPKVAEQAEANGGEPFWLRPMIDTARDGQVEVLDYLLAQDGVDVNQPCEAYGNLTALHLAAECNDKAVVVDLLLNNGADPKAVDDAGKTTLHYIYPRSFDYHLSLQDVLNQQCIAARLIASGADVNAQDNEGNTALHEAYRARAEFQGELDYLQREMQSSSNEFAGRESPDSDSPPSPLEEVRQKQNSKTYREQIEQQKAIIKVYDEMIARMVGAGANDRATNGRNETPEAYANRCVQAWESDTERYKASPQAAARADSRGRGFGSQGNRQ